MEIQDLATLELDDADGIVRVLVLGEFGVTSGETRRPDSLDARRGRTRVGVSAGGFGAAAAGKAEEPTGHVDIVDPAVQDQPSRSLGKLDKEAYHAIRWEVSRRARSQGS